MRRTSLRPRQIDVHARMRILRSQEDLDQDDDLAAGAAPSTTFDELVAALDDQQLLLQVSSGATTATSSTGNGGAGAPATPAATTVVAPAVVKPRRKKNIPIPVTLPVESYEDEVSADFVVPTSYVRFQTVPSSLGAAGNFLAAPLPSTVTIAVPSRPAAKHADDEESQVELDMEVAEMQWLKSHPKYGENGDPRYQLSLPRFARMLECLENACAMINPNVITLAEAEEVLAKELGIVKTPLYRVTVDVYNYWVAKRQALKRPLLRKYWPQTPLNDTNPHLVFRPREKERYKLRKHRKNDMDGYRKLMQLRSDFERVKQMLELVMRRERAKRLEVEFLDEIRQQATYELTDRSGVTRKPTIPIEDMKLDKKKRKKKRKANDQDDEHQDDASRSRAGAQDSSSGTGSAASGGVTGSTAAPAAVSQGVSGSNGNLADVSTRMSTFMDYDTTENVKAFGDGDSDLDQPFYPSYPLPSSQVLASVFARPPKFRCRGRVGRGGRLIIDRVPMPGSRYNAPAEFLAPRRDFGTKASKAQVNGDQGLGTMPANWPGEAINSGHHAPILVHEASFRPLSQKIDSLTPSRLDEIYTMSDSEDELVEPLMATVIEVSSSRKTSSSAKLSQSLPSRQVKFAIDV
ncbi:hypothetical protein PINS_up002646 [Pythium insidiosum]|nr:hypothetical protein PINS_up002646 [Pythium insidiosum]